MRCPTLADLPRPRGQNRVAMDRRDIPGAGKYAGWEALVEDQYCHAVLQSGPVHRGDDPIGAPAGLPGS
mgnify:FL=1|jgi:hypothetical protein